MARTRTSSGTPGGPEPAVRSPARRSSGRRPGAGPRRHQGAAVQHRLAACVGPAVEAGAGKVHGSVRPDPNWERLGEIASLNSHGPVSTGMSESVAIAKAP